MENEMIGWGRYNSSHTHLHHKEDMIEHHLTPYYSFTLNHASKHINNPIKVNNILNQSNINNTANILLMLIWLMYSHTHEWYIDNRVFYKFIIYHAQLNKKPLLQYQLMSTINAQRKWKKGQSPFLECCNNWCSTLSFFMQEIEFITIVTSH